MKNVKRNSNQKSFLLSELVHWKINDQTDALLPFSFSIKVHTLRSSKKGRRTNMSAHCTRPPWSYVLHRHCLNAQHLVKWVLIIYSIKEIKALGDYIVSLCIIGGKERPHLFEYAQLILHICIQQFSNFLSNRTHYPMKLNFWYLKWLRIGSVHLLGTLNSRLRTLIFSELVSSDLFLYIFYLQNKSSKVIWMRCV